MHKGTNVISLALLYDLPGIHTYRISSFEGAPPYPRTLDAAVCSRPGMQVRRSAGTLLRDIEQGGFLNRQRAFPAQPHAQRMPLSVSIWATVLALKGGRLG